MRVLLRVLAVSLLLCLTVFLIALPFLGFLGAALITDSPALAGTVSTVVLLAGSVPGLCWVARRLLGGKGPWRTAGFMVFCALMIATLAFQVFLRPLPGTDVTMPLAPTGHWELATGSRIAYLHVPARGERRATPVIRLHGGPGIPDYLIEYDGRPNPRPLDRLAEDGFEVYYYDQIGCGNSARLSDVRAYSIRRHVEDLEAIRQALEADQVVLVGLSWGATLAAQYCAAYPNRVAKVVFESPGHLWSGPYPNDSDGREDMWKPPQERQQRAAQLMRKPRVVFGAVLLRVNPQLTARLVSDAELSRFLALLFQQFGDEHTVCDPQRMPPHAARGVGAYALLQTVEEYRRMVDPRASLATNPVPALILHGRCEWLKPQVAQDYVQAFPNSKFREIEQGGHLLYLEQPEEYLQAIRFFLIENR